MHGLWPAEAELQAKYEAYNEVYAAHVRQGRGSGAAAGAKRKGAGAGGGGVAAVTFTLGGHSGASKKPRRMVIKQLSAKKPAQEAAKGAGQGEKLSALEKAKRVMAAEAQAKAEREHLRKEALQAARRASSGSSSLPPSGAAASPGSLALHKKAPSLKRPKGKLKEAGGLRAAAGETRPMVADSA